jgi:thiopeptide-type bacteriocin biosynthesis protein
MATRFDIGIATPEYTVFDKAFLRAPLLPVSCFSLLAQHFDSPKELIASITSHTGLAEEFVLRAIAVASPDLVRALNQPVASPRALSSLRRYLLRMCTRATPFGYFAGVAIVPVNTDRDNWPKIVNVRFDRQISRTSMMSAVLPSLLDAPDLLKVEVCSNPCLEQDASHVYTWTESTSESLVKTAKRSPLVDQIIELSQSRISVTTLLSRVNSDNSLDDQKLLSLIRTLLAEGFLVSSAIDDVLLAPQNRQKPHTRNSPESSSDVKRDETVNFATLELSGSVHQHIGESARDCAVLLLQISPQDRLCRALRAYERLFNERYGVRRVVPLTEVASRRIGIGLPSETLTDQVEEWDPAYIRFVGDVWSRGIDDGGEVELTSEDFAEVLAQPRTRQRWPESLDINVVVERVSASFDQNQSFRLHLAPYPGCIGAGRHMGRFIPLLGDAAISFRREIAVAERKTGSRKCWVDLAFSPLKDRLVNVIAEPDEKSLTVSDCPRQGHLSPKDLALVFAADRLRIVSLRDGEEVKVRCQHMVNVRYAPRLYRLLLEISNGYSRRIARFDWGPLKSARRQPRVLFRDCVVSPARWRLDAETIRDSERILMAQKKHHIPDHIYVGGEDSRLLLDLRSEAHRGELARLSSNGAATVEVEEAVDPQRLGMLKSDMGEHCTELIVSIALKSRDGQSAPVKKYHSSEAHTFTPGSEWVYLKIPSSEETEERLIAMVILPMIASHIELIDTWFFVRYSYPDHHIRLRAKACKGNAQRLLNGLLTSMRVIVSDRHASKFSVESYQPEEDRFGGAQFLDVVTSLFQAESEVIAAVFKHTDRRSPTARVVAGLRLARTLLSAAGIDDDHQISILSATGRSPTASAVWRECRNEARGVVLGVADSSCLSEAYANFEACCTSVFGSEWGDVVRSDERIVKDLLHMQANRIYGTERSLEVLRLKILERAILSIKMHR